MPLSVMGRQHPTTRRVLRFFARARANREAGAPIDAKRDTALEVTGANARDFDRILAHRMHSMMLSLSSLVVLHLVEGMFAAAYVARPTKRPSRMGSGGGTYGGSPPSVRSDGVVVVVPPQAPCTNAALTSTLTSSSSTQLTAAYSPVVCGCDNAPCTAPTMTTPTTPSVAVESSAIPGGDSFLPPAPPSYVVSSDSLFDLHSTGDLSWITGRV